MRHYWCGSEVDLERHEKPDQSPLGAVSECGRSAEPSDCACLAYGWFSWMASYCRHLKRLRSVHCEDPRHCTQLISQVRKLHLCNTELLLKISISVQWQDAWCCSGIAGQQKVGILDWGFVGLPIPVFPYSVGCITPGGSGWGKGHWVRCLISWESSLATSFSLMMDFERGPNTLINCNFEKLREQLNFCQLPALCGKAFFEFCQPRWITLRLPIPHFSDMWVPSGNAQSLSAGFLKLDILLEHSAIVLDDALILMV